MGEQLSLDQILNFDEILIDREYGWKFNRCRHLLSLLSCY